MQKLASHALLGFVVALAAATAFACSSQATTSAPPGVDAGDDGRSKPRTVGEQDGDGPSGPERLSETGLYSDFAARTIAADVTAFAPAYPLWSDGETKRRYIQLPAGEKIDTSDMDWWTFPVGTKLWKEFVVDGKLVETRMLWKQVEGPGFDGWWAMAYVWEPDGSDAVAKPAGVVRVADTNHDVPSQEDCKKCHGNVVDGVIGFSAFQLSRVDGGGEGTGLLVPLASRGIFTDPAKSDLVVPGDGLVREALSYFHGNCGFCHNAKGGLQFQSVMRLNLHASDRTPEETAVYTTAINAKMRHADGDIDRAIVPGQPEKSQAYVRMIATNITRMPPNGPKLVDPTGSDVVRRWILALTP